MHDVISNLSRIFEAQCDVFIMIISVEKEGLFWWGQIKKVGYVFLWGEERKKERDQSGDVLKMDHPIFLAGKIQ